MYVKWHLFKITTTEYVKLLAKYLFENILDSAWRAFGSGNHSVTTCITDEKMRVHIIPALSDNYMYLV